MFNSLTILITITIKRKIMMKSQFRKLNNSAAEIDMENQIITFSVASEMPFERQDKDGNLYNEILIMSDDAVNLERLKGRSKYSEES